MMPFYQKFSVVGLRNVLNTSQEFSNPGVIMDLKLNWGRELLWCTSKNVHLKEIVKNSEFVTVENWGIVCGGLYKIITVLPKGVAS